MREANASPRCHNPWQMMVIDVKGNAKPCCFWIAFGHGGNPMCGNVNDTPLLDIWNGEVYQNLRKNMAEGNLEAAGCAHCMALKRGHGMELCYDPAAEREAPPYSEYAKNLKLLKEEVRKGATILQSKPNVISLNASHQCNLRCIHCWQALCRDAKIENGRVFEEVLELIPVLDRIVAGGGEPFAIPFWKRFVTSGDISRNAYLGFSTSTNATLINEEILKGLRRFKRLQIVVSFDGADKRTLETVRVNANFEAFVRNVDRLQALIDGKPQSWVHFTGSIMKANIHNLPEMIRFAGLRRISLGLFPVIDRPLEQVLNCFNNPAEQMKGWKEAIEESYAMLDKYVGVWARKTKHTAYKIWRNHIASVDNSIPWHILEREHFPVKGELPASMVRLHVKRYGKCLLTFCSPNGSAHPTCEYYSPLNENGYEVHLPTGKYAVELVPAINRPRSAPFMHLEVDSQGTARLSNVQQNWQASNIVASVLSRIRGRRTA